MSTNNVNYNDRGTATVDKSNKICCLKQYCCSECKYLCSFVQEAAKVVSLKNPFVTIEGTIYYYCYSK